MNTGLSSKVHEGMSRRALLGMMGATGAILAGSMVAAKATTADSTIEIDDIRSGEDVFAYVNRPSGSFDQVLYLQVIGAANEFKAGDQAIGVCAANEATAVIIWIVNTPIGSMKYVDAIINATGITKKGVLLPSFLICTRDTK